ncbi:MAG: hypothetical protein NT062_39165, partial [Proteobacteria bacterium]|nr:hypothetical protein [Pseudomonadota bacterium]
MRLSVGIPLLACAACGFQGHGKPADDGGLDTSTTSDTLVVDSPDAHVGPADWWNPAWQFRRRVTVDNTGLVEDLTDFPVPIRLADTTHLAAVGADVRFVSDFGVELPYDTDELDAGDASFWVQLTIP